MAKKKPSSSDNTPSPRRRGSKAEKPQPPADAASQAAALLAQIREEMTPAQQVDLAKQAIAADPDCVEAYGVLAEYARSRKQALGFHEQAVAAAERRIGPELFAEAAGRFSEVPAAAAYLQARQALAEALWSQGRRDEAATHLLHLLRLDADDPHRLREPLMAWLLNLDRLDDLDALLERFGANPTTAIRYTQALLAFRRSGDGVAARKLLRAARKQNPWVPNYLFGDEPLPDVPPERATPGEPDEAAYYVGHHLGAWKATAGAIAWARTTLRPPRKKKAAQAPTVKAPSPRTRASLQKIGHEFDVWQVDFRQFARRIEIGGERVRPWMMLVASRTNQMILAHDLAEGMPGAGELWNLLVAAIRKPFAGAPHRPTAIEVRPHPQWQPLEGELEQLGVELVTVPELEHTDMLFDDLVQHLTGSEPPGLLDMPGVTAPQVQRLFEAAANFYKQAPWRKLGFESVVRVECDRYESGPWFAVVMGQSGLTLGLALYEDLKLLKRMWAGKLSDEEGARMTVALTVTFEDESSLVDVDLEAIETHGWPIAAPEAYPSVFRKERGLTMRPPLSWEIDLLDACLRALPGFIARRRPDDPTRELVPVIGTPGPIELGLSWVPESH